jgi:hypothetical protein
MDSLPIYETILNEIDNDIDITHEDKINLSTNITKNNDTHEIVFVIIRYYQIKNSSNITNLPYSSKYLKTKNGYKFDIDFLPTKLIKMLIKFYEIHQKSQNNINNNL